jgi:hypothetical protein
VYGITPTTTAAVALGYEAASGTTSAVAVTALGYQALKTNTATRNTGIGFLAGAINTSSLYNVYVGSYAGNAATGANNTGVGDSALGASTGSNNTGIGFQAAVNTTSGGSNTAVGTQALFNNTTASNVTAVGYQAGYSNTTSTQFTYIGYQAGYSATGGSNTFIGWQAGYYTTATTSGYANTYIGNAARGNSATNNNEIVIGNDTAGKGSATGFINPNGGGVYQGNNAATWSVTSDQRLKKNIVDNTVGLIAINSIRVRNFEYCLPEEVDAELKPQDAVQKSGVQLGVIAQELQAVLPDCVKTESSGVMSVNSDNLTWYLVNAIKELKAEIDQLKGNV